MFLIFVSVIRRIPHQRTFPSFLPVLCWTLCQPMFLIFILVVCSISHQMFLVLLLLLHRISHQPMFLIFILLLHRVPHQLMFLIFVLYPAPNATPMDAPAQLRLRGDCLPHRIQSGGNVGRKPGAQLSLKRATTSRNHVIAHTR